MLGVLLLLASPVSGFAQGAYPTKPVRLVVVWPGFRSHLTARVIGQRLTKTMGQQFVIENKPGGGSTVAAEQVARAPKDGYTLFIGTAANVINGVMQPNLPFDFAKDFAPITYTTSSPNILVVHPSVGVSDVKGLIALLKQKPEQIFTVLPASVLAAFIGRVAQYDGRHEDGARALLGKRPGGHGSVGRPYPGDVLAGLDGAATCCERPAEGVGLIRTDARIFGS